MLPPIQWSQDEKNDSFTGPPSSQKVREKQGCTAQHKAGHRPLISPCIDFFQPLDKLKGNVTHTEINQGKCVHNLQ